MAYALRNDRRKISSCKRMTYLNFLYSSKTKFICLVVFRKIILVDTFHWDVLYIYVYTRTHAYIWTKYLIGRNLFPLLRENNKYPLK